MSASFLLSICGEAEESAPRVFRFAKLVALESSGADPSPSRLTKARRWDSGWHVDEDGIWPEMAVSVCERFIVR
jgi:hypothetical protein